MKEQTEKPPKNLTGETIETPAGKIRPHQRTPYRKASAEEVEQRVELCAQLICQQATMGQIKKVFREKFNLNYRAVYIYIARARKYLAVQAGRSKDDMRREGVGLLQSIIRTGTTKEKLAAEKRLAEIFGYDSPHRSEISGPDSAPIKVEHKSRTSSFDWDKFGELCRGVQVGHNGNGHKQPVHPAVPGAEAGVVSRVGLS